MNDTGVKQQIVDAIQGADTILVTVNTDPTVDELSAALGLTMYLNDMGKHATAVVSGGLPPAINFLEPEKTFEPTVDSLRDFVIALDKEKADHLRYKVEGDVVKIFITPYKTVITDKDLNFTQGDYNVEAVIALGVTDQDHLDKALAAHGKILHDATVATIGTTQSTLGTLDWTDETASSVSELVTNLVSGMKNEDNPVSSQVASALLTGIVAATDRFSNDKTSSRTMSLAGELMAEGANQQLIASKLREGAKLPLDDGASQKISKQPKEEPKPKAKKKDTGLSITHSEVDAVEETPMPLETGAPAQTPTDTLDAALKQADDKRESEAAKQTDDLIASLGITPDEKKDEDVLSEQLATVAPVEPQTPSILDELKAESELSPAKVSAPSDDEPSFGGVLNATTEQAAQDKRALEGNDKNKTILSHGSGQYVGDSQPTFESVLNGAGQTGEMPSVDPFAAAPTAKAEPLAPPTPAGTLADIDEQNRDKPYYATPAPEAAADAVNAVLEASPDPQPFNPLEVIENTAPGPAVQVENETVPVAPLDIPNAPMTPPPPPMPDFSQLPPLPPPPAFPQPDVPAAPVGPLPPLQPVAPLAPLPPEMPQAPLPPEQLGSVLPEAPNVPAAPTVGPVDPKQFRIPGQ